MRKCARLMPAPASCGANGMSVAARADVLSPKQGMLVQLCGMVTLGYGEAHSVHALAGTIQVDVLPFGRRTNPGGEKWLR